MKYPKLNKTKCKYPDRNDCNNDENNHRCEFMKYKRDPQDGYKGWWICTY